MKRFYTLLGFLFIVALGNAQTYSSFKLFDSMPLDTFNDGRDLSGEFIDGNLRFPSVYDTVWGYWKSGWAVSTMRDDTTDDATNLYSVITGARIDESPYALGQNNSFLQTENKEGVLFEGMYISNTTFAYFSMKNGDAFAKKFGGDTGNDPDFFKLRIYGMKNNNADSTNFIDFYLADFRFDEDSLDYIVDDWWYVDLSPLGYVEGLSFELSSSDVGDWGMNTPAFFAVDKIKYSYDYEKHFSDFVISFEENNLSLDSTWIGENADDNFFDSGFSFPSVYDTSYGGYWASGFALSTMRDDINHGSSNLYSCIAGGAYDGITYAISQNNTKFKSERVDAFPVIKNIKITNTSYAYYSMKEGDAFAKKFGGATGDDPDFFKLRIYPLQLNDLGKIDSSRYYDFYLADFRFDDNSKDYIVDDWINVNIDSIFDFEVSELAFELISSDVGDWGMNTPAFFALDAMGCDLVLGTNNQELLTQINVFPNPASDYINIDVFRNDNYFDYKLVDMSGKVLIKGQLSQQKTIYLNGIKAGIYFVEVSNGNRKAVKKIVKL